MFQFVCPTFSTKLQVNNFSILGNTRKKKSHPIYINNVHNRRVMGIYGQTYLPSYYNFYVLWLGLKGLY